MSTCNHDWKPEVINCKRQRFDGQKWVSEKQRMYCTYCGKTISQFKFVVHQILAAIIVCIAAVCVAASVMFILVAFVHLVKSWL